MPKWIVFCFAAFLMFSTIGCAPATAPSGPSSQSVPAPASAPAEELPSETGSFFWNKGSMAITKEQAVYFSAIDPVQQHRAFYRFDLKQQKTEKLLEVATYLELNVIGDGLYGVRDMGEEREFPFVEINPDGQPGAVIPALSGATNIFMTDKWVYYQQKTALMEGLNGICLFRMNPATNEVQQLTFDETPWYALDGKWVYFMKREEGPLYRFRPGAPETLESHQFWSGRVRQAIVYKGELYFTPHYEFGDTQPQKIYRCAWQAQPVEVASTNEVLHDLKPFGGYLYWSTRAEDTGNLYRTHLDSLQTELVVPNCSQFEAFDEYLCYRMRGSTPIEMQLFLIDQQDQKIPIPLH